jgi:tripartite-type tricarboxylate transporter receptor subunit TctC
MKSLLNSLDWHFVAAILITLNCVLPAYSQGFPNRPVNLIIPYPAGGSLDVVGREVAQRLRTSWNQNVVVENKAGASGNIGSAQVAQAVPDGHTLLLTTNAPLVINRFILRDIQFNPAQDLTPLLLAAVTPIALVVHSSVPAMTLAEFIEYARRKPGEVSFASSGTGSPHHLQGELLKSAAQIDIRHVPYRGAAPAINDLVGGHISAGFITLGTILPHHLAGRVRILAVAEDVRSNLAPGITTIGETVPSYRGAPTGWHAFLAPRGISPDLAAKITADLREALSQPETTERLAAAGIVVTLGGVSDLATRMRSESAAVQEIVMRIGLKPE